MPSRFDHLVIAVRDLDVAISRYQRLGFEVTPGGRHTGLGTYNALIRFGLDYIELISVYNEDEVRANRAWGDNLVRLLQERESLFLGYALATTTIEQEAERFSDLDELATEPYAMYRTRPDGHRLSWRLFVPGGVSWRRSWPFIIQWDTPDEQRLQIERPGKHPNGIIAWRQVSVAVQNPASAHDLYQQRLGLEHLGDAVESGQAANRSSYRIGNSTIDLLTPTGEGPVQKALAEIGEGPIEATLTVKDLEQTRRYFARTGVAFKEKAATSGTLLLDPKETAGVRILLAQ